MPRFCGSVGLRVWWILDVWVKVHAEGPKDPNNDTAFSRFCKAYTDSDMAQSTKTG